MTSARPFDTASSVEKRWKTRTGSSVDSTVTAVPSRMREVRPATAASTTSGAEIAKSSRWCSPRPIESTPRESASAASTTTSRSTWSMGLGRPSGPSVTSPKVSRPREMAGMTVPVCGKAGAEVDGSAVPIKLPGRTFAVRALSRRRRALSTS